MNENKYQQCTRCVMDNYDPGITFDKNGYCNYCTEYIEKTSKRVYLGKETDKKLTQLIEKIKESGKNKKYDCIIGISGGADSCYATYLLKKLGLRALAVHMDNGWDTEASVINIRYLVDKLGFDYESYVLDWEEFKDLQLALLKASVPELENPTDIATLGALHEIAEIFKVKYIISGGNFVTEGILPKSYQYNSKDIRYLKAILKQFGTKKLKKFPTFGWLKEMYFKFIKGIRIIYILNYIPYSKDEAIKILEQELGWKNHGGKHYESVYTRFVHSYLLPVKFNIDYRKATYSTLICAGTMTREEALKDLAIIPYDITNIEDNINYVCKKLCISLQEFNRIMKIPPKTYKDYPNNNKKLEFIYKVYRKLMYR